MIPSTVDRVPRHTAPRVNRRIRASMGRRVRLLRRSGPEAIDRRLRKLDREWDVERVLELNASAIALTGLGLGVFLHRRFLALPAAVLAFLMQHAVQGWCPPIPILRRLGVRTANEIEEERRALTKRPRRQRRAARAG